MSSIRGSCLKAHQSSQRRFRLVKGVAPDPPELPELSEQEEKVSLLLKKHNLNPACAGRASGFFVELRGTIPNMTEETYQKTLRAVDADWEARRKGRR